MKSTSSKYTNIQKSLKRHTKSTIQIIELTNIVNFPVSSSECRGSLVGSNLVRPSRCLVISCCSNRAKERATSNLRANKKRTAIDHVTGPNFRRNFAFTFSINSLVAWNNKKYHSLKKPLCEETYITSTITAYFELSFPKIDIPVYLFNNLFICSFLCT